MHYHKYDCIFKILTMGESGVGKTEFMCKYTGDSYPEARESLKRGGKLIIYL